MMRAGPRRGIDQSRTGCLESFESFLNVVDTNGDVMNSLAALGDELVDRRTRGDRLQQLDAAVTGRKHRNTHALVVDLIVTRHLQPDDVLIEVDGVRQRLYCDSNVIDLHMWSTT